MHFNSPVRIFTDICGFFYSYLFSFRFNSIYTSLVYSVSVRDVQCMISPVNKCKYVCVCIIRSDASNMCEQFRYGFFFSLHFVFVEIFRFFCFIRSVLFHRNLINFPCKFYLWLFNEHVAILYCKYIRLHYPTCKTIGLMWPTTHTNHNKFNIRNICAIDLKMSQFEFNKVFFASNDFLHRNQQFVESIVDLSLFISHIHITVFLLLNSHLIWLHTFPWSNDWLYEHWTHCNITHRFPKLFHFKTYSN